MIELGPFAREKAQQFPKGHPERVALEGMAAIAENWARRNGAARTEILPTPEQLVASEKEAWKQFLGKEINIPEPPQQLFEAARLAIEHGITSFEAHLLPKLELKQNSKFPGWHIKPEEWYWQKIKEGEIAKDAARLPGVWVLVDGAQKPNYDDGKQLYENDGFGQILLRLREEGRIETPNSYSHVPRTSRFAVTPIERETHFYQALAEVLNVGKDKVRITREIESNIIGNIHHPEWGQTNTSEWFDDKFGDGRRLVGGRSDYGGLARVDCNWRDDRLGNVGFRPLIVFSSSKS